MFQMVIANILGVFILFYMLWHVLKDDYQYEKIFNLGFLILFGYLLGLVVSRYILKDYWFWTILVGISIGFVFAIKKQKMKFFDVFEGTVIGLLPWISVFYLFDSIDKSSLKSFISFWLGLICIALFFFFKSYYRTFTWYRSGRVGFAGVLTAIIFFLIRALSSHELYLSGAVALILFLVLYKLSIKKE